MFTAKKVLHMSLFGCLLWGSLAIDPNCVKIDMSGNCVEKSNGVQTLPSNPANLVIQPVPLVIPPTQTVPTPPVNMPGAPVFLTSDQYLTDDGFISINAKLRRQNDLNGYIIQNVSKQLVNGLIYQLSYINSQGQTANFRVYLSFQGQIEVLPGQSNNPSNDVPPNVVDPPPQAVVNTNQQDTPTQNNQQDTQTQNYQYDPYNPYNPQNNNLRSYAQAESRRININPAVQGIKKTKQFAACYQALLQTYPFFNNSDIQDITLNRDAYGITTYHVTLTTTQNISYDVILQYNNITETPNIINFFSQTP